MTQPVTQTVSEPSTEPKRSCPASPDDDLEVARRLAEALADQIAGYRPDASRPKVSARWVTDMDRLLRLGDPSCDPTPVPEETIVRCLAWLKAGAGRQASFWQGNVRSPDALRRNWERLVADSKSEKAAARTGPRAAVNDEWADGPTTSGEIAL